MSQPSTNTKPATSSVPAEVLESVLTTMEMLDAALLQENPGLDTYLVRINNNLRSFPDLIHLLTDEQAAPLYKAMIKKADLVLTPAKKKAESNKKNAAPENVDNLFGF